MNPPPFRAHIREATHRLIASRYPTVGVFDDLTTDKDELVTAFLLESVTNDRLAVLSRRLSLLPPEEIVQGPGASLVMAAFLHADPAGGRFTDGRLGAWYASLDVATAIAETVHHSTRRLRLSTGAFPSNIQMRQLIARIDSDLVDIRGQQAGRPDLYDRDDYSASQAFGLDLRWPASGQRRDPAGEKAVQQEERSRRDDSTGSSDGTEIAEHEDGIIYDAVRRADGTNVCVYRPSRIVLPVNQGDHYEYRWDIAGQVTVLKITNADTATDRKRPSSDIR